MMLKILFLSFQAFSQTSAPAVMEHPVVTDIKAQITHVVGSAANVEVFLNSSKGETHFECSGNRFALKVFAEPREVFPAAYAALRDMGFLFPHPRIELKPTLEKLRTFCGRKFVWKPRLGDRGFHLHLQHPNEWVDGFLMDQKEIARSLIWWLARNGQNLLQLQMVEVSDSVLKNKINPLFAEARNLGIKVGLSFSLSSMQQNSYNLISWWRAYFGWGSDSALKSGIENILSKVDMDFLSLEMGTSEFTATDPKRTLEWLNLAGDLLKEKNMRLYVKNHASMGQKSPEFGNFNFLPKFANPEVGCLPHTVFFYGLNDGRTPMYGRNDFIDMADFLRTESRARPCMYFPETSYWVGMDMDIPLLLTDYLVARTQDVDWLEKNGLSAQLNFTSGQENGSWLLDWQVALLADSRSKGDPLYALKLLGEDPKVWEPILKWQTLFFKQRQVIAMITAANLMDEIPWMFHRVHERKTIPELRDNQQALRIEVGQLQDALQASPPLDGIRNPELKIIMNLTKSRLTHSLLIRQALKNQLDNVSDESNLNEAKVLREKSLEQMQMIIKDFNRYPESFTYQEKDNPTSYPYGYLWPASNLHFWEREELQVKNHKSNPFFMNIYNPLRILF
jgi:hypothetical protein